MHTSPDTAADRFFDHLPTTGNISFRRELSDIPQGKWKLLKIYSSYGSAMSMRYWAAIHNPEFDFCVRDTRLFARHKPLQAPQSLAASREG